MNIAKKLITPIAICSIFFILYAVLGIVRHDNYGSFGADLGFIDHLVWVYSKFQYAKGSYDGHIELIFLLISPFYWIWSDPRMLIILQAFVIAFSGIPVFLLAKNKKLRAELCFVILLSYLMFFGIQNGIWFDVHSAAFGAGFMAWYIYFLEKKNLKWSLVAFFLAVFSKENIAAYILLVSGVHFIITRNRLSLIYSLIAFVYLFLLFFVYFPAIRPNGYAYANPDGLVSGSIQQLADNSKKIETIFYTFAWYGFIPLLSPLTVLPVLGNLASYFILGRSYTAAHEIFMHYRIDLAPLLAFSTVLTIAKYKWLNKRVVAGYLLICLLVFQYLLHLPLSYLTKQWFWTRPTSVDSINRLISYLPEEASVVAQNNIYPHISQREDILLLWPDERSFKKIESPCGKELCHWFRWEKGYQYLIVDLSPEWDIRHLLQNNEDFKEAVLEMEKEGIIKLVKQDGTTRLYTIEKPAK